MPGAFGDAPQRLEGRTGPYAESSHRRGARAALLAREADAAATKMTTTTTTSMA